MWSSDLAVVIQFVLHMTFILKKWDFAAGSNVHEIVTPQKGSITTGPLFCKCWFFWLEDTVCRKLQYTPNPSKSIGVSFSKRIKRAIAMAQGLRARTEAELASDRLSATRAAGLSSRDSSSDRFLSNDIETDVVMSHFVEPPALHMRNSFHAWFLTGCGSRWRQKTGPSRVRLSYCYAFYSEQCRKQKSVIFGRPLVANITSRFGTRQNRCGFVFPKVFPVGKLGHPWRSLPQYVFFLCPFTSFHPRNWGVDEDGPLRWCTKTGLYSHIADIADIALILLIERP